MRLFLNWCLFFSVFSVFSQEKISTDTVSKIKIDSLYREDQFYFAITYNTFINKPAGLSPSKFSSGFSGGFLRDMPINKTRTLAIASGVGLSYANYNQNMVIGIVPEDAKYSIIAAEVKYSKNKFSLLTFDVPIEFRWRTSTYESHKFWRVYTGIKFSYLLYDTSVFDGATGKVVSKDNKDFNKLQYGAYIALGYNTVNLYAQYGLNPFFKSAKINDEPLKLKSLNLGIIFYIL